MPVSIRKTDGKYSVSTPNQTHAFGTTKKKAERQARLLNAIDHGWKPTGKPARESIHEEALEIVNALLERDDINSVPIPASGRAYARLHGGIPALRRKQQLYINMARDLGNRGKPTHGFKDYEGSAYTGPKHEGMDNAPVTRPLERSKVEKTKLHGGHYGKHVASHGKTSGKFKFPSNYAVGHAMKS